MKTCCLCLLVCFASLGCESRYRDDLDYSYDVVQSWTVDEIESEELIQYESVDCDLVASTTIRQAIAKDEIASGRNVLHIGSGTGLIASLCLHYDAKTVLATDVHPAAVSNTRYNVAAIAPDGALETRLRPASQSDAFSAIESDEKFDLIITDLDQNHCDDSQDSEDRRQMFRQSFVDALANHLSPGGRAIVIGSRKETIASLFDLGRAKGMKIKSLEEDFENRDWQSLPSPYSPAFLFEVRPE